MRYAPERQTTHQSYMHQQPMPRVHQNNSVQTHQNQPERKPSSHQGSEPKISTPPKREEQRCQCCEKREKNILEKFLPENIYNPKTKKLFGLLSPEELLLVALIFLFADSERDDSNLLCLALLYLLFADKFDLSAFLK